ncbi:MAG: alpha-amylase family protein [Acidimicrobiia bacterium]
MAGEQQWHFEARVARWWPELRSLLAELYGAAGVDALSERLLAHARLAHDARPHELQRLDARRAADPSWFQAADRIGYVAYADRFGGTLDGVRRHLDHLADLHVTYFHLMKVLRARAGPNDGGYAVVDHADVDPALGTRADLGALAGDLRSRGISLCLDVVLNHTAREHAWAEAARAGSRRHRDYYLVFPDRTMPDRYEATLPEVFPELAPGSFTWEPDLDGWVWTTFNTYQWDLNYANPDVFVEMFTVMTALANVGVEILRLDAIAFTWKRLGTNCQNQPEAHLLAQAYRALMAIVAPAVLLKAEAIVAPTDLVPYLGAHANQREECHLAYHNQLMVMLWSSLAMQDAALASEALASLPPTPPGASWVTYLRCHDDIGWAVSDEIATRVGLSGPAHRAYLAAFYRGDFPGSYARGAAFSSNPSIGDERTVGSAAALCGITAARESGDDESLELGIRRLLVAYGVVLGFGGIPLLYMGDEVAMGNDTTYVQDPALADDSRWMNRPWMDWGAATRRRTGRTVEQRVFDELERMIAIRISIPAMATGGETWIHRLPDTAVLGWARRHPRHGRFYGLANLAARPATVPLAALGWAGLSEPIQRLASDGLAVDGDRLVLPPLGLAWYVDGADTEVLPRRPQ